MIICAALQFATGSLPQRQRCTRRRAMRGTIANHSDPSRILRLARQQRVRTHANGRSQARRDRFG